ncbi:MAG TPA: DUF6297 family protein [Marmoricola sp.]|nr:DUF6297 family protein [Marmoricola sp.]
MSEATADGTAVPEVREIRADMRHWRRGRAEAHFWDVFTDAYIAVFATVMFGAIAINILVHARWATAAGCRSGGCAEARSWLPWVVALAVAVAVLGAARLFGPAHASPASASWLLAAPLDRPALLRPALLVLTGATTLAAVLVAAAVATLTGFTVAAIIAYAVSLALASVGLLGLAVLAQAGRPLLGRVLTWALAAAAWAVLLLIALDDAPVLGSPTVGVGWIAVLVVVLLLAAAAAAVALRRLGRLTRHDLAPGGKMAPGLSGALATLDLALLYDVLLTRRWAAQESVRSRRGGPSGPMALVSADLVRLRRSPQTLLVVAAVVVVPYAAATLGLGRAQPLAVSLTGFLAGLGLCSALRVVTRTPSLLRAMPFAVSTTRSTMLVVPGVALLLFGLACTPTLHASLDVPWSTAAGMGLACGGAALAAAARWVTGRPPDYSRPLVSTPAGGVPTNLYGSVLRGFDIWAVTTVPMLLWPSSTGVLVSLVLSWIVVQYLVARP